MKRRVSISQRIVNEVRENLNKYSNNLTKKQYLKNFKRFIKYCREKYDCRTLDECKKHVQDYSNYLQEKGLSASTVHTYLAPVCVLTNTNMSQISKPIRHTSRYFRGRNNESLLKSRDLQDLKWKYIVEFQRKVGLRRAELERLTGKDFVLDESGNWCVYTKGKGGKVQLQLIKDEDVEFVSGYFKDKSPNERIIEKCEFKNNLNFHFLRAECAKQFYLDTLKRLRTEPNYEKELIEQIRKRWNKYNLTKNGRPKPFDYKRVQGYYYLRGKNREKAIEHGGSIKFNKLAVFATSVFKLSHWRLDVTINSYLAISNGGLII